MDDMNSDVSGTHASTLAMLTANVRVQTADPSICIRNASIHNGDIIVEAKLALRQESAASRAKGVYVRLHWLERHSPVTFPMSCMGVPSVH